MAGLGSFRAIQNASFPSKNLVMHSKNTSYLSYRSVTNRDLGLNKK